MARVRTSGSASSTGIGDKAAANLSSCACFNTRGAARAVTAFYDRTLEPSGLRTTQMAILAAIHAQGSLTMQALAAGLGLDPSTMTRTLGPLQKSELVRVRSSDDRRVRELELTSLGRRRLAQAGRLWERAQQELRSRLGARRFERLIADLAELQDALRD